MNKRITTEIMKEYEQMRDLVEKTYKQRKDEVYDRIPRIREIDVEMAKVSIKASKAIFDTPKDSQYILKEMEYSIKKLQQEKAFLLTEHNIPINYLEKVYNCSNCNDTGFDNTGKKCGCFKQRIINHGYKMSNLNQVLEKENFQTFDLNVFSDEIPKGEVQSPRDNMKEILSLCESFVYNFETANNSLLFYGKTGLGKTFLCNAIAKSLLDRGNLVVYQTSFNILELLERRKFKKESEPFDNFNYDMLFDADLLIIDDLGTEMGNTFTNTEIFNIINTRLLKSKKTLISTNLTPVEIRKIYSDRVSSRLFGNFSLLRFFGPDLRWKSK
jgi:DNA replication protein DnaC